MAVVELVTAKPAAAVLGLKDPLQDGQGLAAADPDNSDPSRPRRGGNGGDGLLGSVCRHHGTDRPVAGTGS
jgi:hypothetical protein